MVFVVIAGMGTEALLQDRILHNYPNNHVQLSPTPGQWLVAAMGTAKDVSDRLGITAGTPDDVDTALVVSVSGYWGREPNHVWQWLAEHWGL